MLAGLPAGYDDGLICPEVGSWAESKYRLFVLYASLFATGMKRKWDERVYIDLYSGAGFVRIRNSDKILLGSPLLALTVADPFDKYIFCEEDPEKLTALRTRAQRLAPNASTVFVQGDCNDRIDEILSHVPLGSREHTVLGLCFVDPYDIGIRFASIRKLTARYLDFVCLLALYMDANRNYAIYIREKSKKIDELLGNSTWRTRWHQAQAKSVGFPKFIAMEFAASMAELGYIPPPFYTMKEVRSDDRNLPLYHLALFSRSPRAFDFWDEVLKYSTDQTGFVFE